MRILIAGACGFVGSTLATSLAERLAGAEIIGFDNLWRPGSETNRSRLKAAGVRVFHGDIRCASDFEALPRPDWVIDAAANASVLAGVDGLTTPRQLIEHNLLGTVNILEYCRRHSSGLIVVSSSRVYSISALRAIPLIQEQNSYALGHGGQLDGLTSGGITENFPTGAPASLYGSTKLASEELALEYGDAFGIPVWINRCGVMAGAGQFGQPAQGIFAWWINQWIRRGQLKYLGFGGKGMQVRDCLHPLDLAALIDRQISSSGSPTEQRVYNVSGGITNAMSLSQLSEWCADRFGAMEVAEDATERQFDAPWIVLDSSSAATRWSWSPDWTIGKVLEQIAEHAVRHPEWLSLSEG